MNREISGGQLSLAGFGERHITATNKDLMSVYGDKATPAARFFCDIVNKKNSLLLTGNSGTGKTFFSCACARQFYKQWGLFPSYFDAETILCHILINRERPSLFSEINGLLIIDEFMDRSYTEKERNLFKLILDTRYRNNLTTYFVSNLPAVEVERATGPKFIRRIKETGHVVSIIGDPYYEDSF